MRKLILNLALPLLFALNTACTQKEAKNQGTVGSDMQKTLLFRNTMKYDKAKEREFKASLNEAVAFTRMNASQLFVHVYLDEQNGFAYSYQLYRDSQDVLAHWKVSENQINNVMLYCEIVKFEVYGEPSEEVVEGIEASVDKNIVSYYKEFCGYNKFPDKE